MAKWIKNGQTINFHYLDNIQSIYLQGWIQQHIFLGGPALFYPIFDVMRQVLKHNVAFRYVLNSQVDFWNALFTKIRLLMSYYLIYCVGNPDEYSNE